MNSPIVFIICCVVGNIVGYNVQREPPYNTGPNDAHIGFNGYEPSQKLFWGNGGSNQVGGTGFWAHLTNKFPFLNNMFGRMELGTEYKEGIPQQYGFPNGYYQGQPQPYQPQFNQGQFNQPRFNQDLFREFVPSTRDVGFTDDAVIITPPQVPIAPPVPARPQPVPEPALGYHYNKPQFRLELPHK